MVIRSTTMTHPPSSAAALSFTETLSLLSLSLASFAVIANTFQGDGAPLVASLAFSGIAFAGSYSMIRWLGPTFMKAGLKGKDMSKLHKKEIPETMGAVCAVVYILIVTVFIPFPFYKDIVAATSGGGNRDVVQETIEHVQRGRFLHKFPHSKVCPPRYSLGIWRLTGNPACSLSLCNYHSSICFHPGYWRRPLRHSLAP